VAAVGVLDPRESGLSIQSDIAQLSFVGYNIDFVDRCGDRTLDRVLQIQRDGLVGRIFQRVVEHLFAKVGQSPFQCIGHSPDVLAVRYESWGRPRRHERVEVIRIDPVHRIWRSRLGLRVLRIDDENLDDISARRAGCRDFNQRVDNRCDAGVA